MTHSAGPVEPAPPRIREIWVETEGEGGSGGVPGGWLTGKLLYWGGTPGLCEFSWISVDAEGERTESDVRVWDPLAPYPPLGSPDAEADPRLRKLEAVDVGCSFKLTCEPVRADGVKGAPSTSKPTADVVEAGGA